MVIAARGGAFQESFWSSGALGYTAVVIIANMKIFVMQNQYRLVHLFFLALSVGAWFAFAYGINLSMTLSQFDWYYVFNHALSSNRFWLGLVWYTGVGIFTHCIVSGLLSSFCSGRIATYCRREAGPGPMRRRRRRRTLHHRYRKTIWMPSPVLSSCQIREKDFTSLDLNRILNLACILFSRYT